MFDGVPARVWLLIAIAATAIGPASYLYRHISQSPSLRDITQPRPDFDRRSDKRLQLSIAAILVLAALGVYICTPAAEHFAASPRFWPIILGGLGCFCLFTVIQDLIDGDIKPLMKGEPFGPYARDGHPFRYWLSMLWNVFMGAFMFWAALSEGFSNQ